MKAAVLEDLNRIVCKDVEDPEVVAGSVLVKVYACAVCGSDIRIFRYGNPRVKPPLIIGHEVAGEIVEVAEGVENFKVGQRICLGADVPCGKCHYCQNGLGNNCPINYAIGYQFPGGFAEYILLNPTTVQFGPVAPLPDSVSYDEGALAEPLACVINGLELVGLKLGDSVVIMGAGPIGCMMIELARHMGAFKVIVMEFSNERLEFARRFNADLYLNSSEVDAVKAAQDATDGAGPDVVITSCPSVEAHEQAIMMVAKRGRVNLFGGLGANARNLNIPSNIIHYKECSVTGSHGSTPRHHRLAVKLIEDGSVKVKELITGTFKLSEIEKAFKRQEDRLGMKNIVKPWDAE